MMSTHNQGEPPIGSDVGGATQPAAELKAAAGEGQKSSSKGGGGLSAEEINSVIDAVEEAVEADDLAGAAKLLERLVAPDVARVLELSGSATRGLLAKALGTERLAEVLPELDETVRDQLVEELPNEVLARAVTELDTDDAAYLIEGLEDEDKEEVLAQIPSSERLALERTLEYPEGTAGRLMQADFVAVPPFWTVGRVIDHMRDADELPETFSDIFVVDAAYRVVGSVDLSRLLRTKREVDITAIMDTERHLMRATADEEAVARQFERYDLRSAPVVDENDRLVGVVTVDDVMEVAAQAADEDARRMAGVGDERLTDSVQRIVRPRISWLVVNLFTAMVAAGVIKMFDATIEQMVALAVLMPIVASLGGNAGAQTMTVTVRALATENLGSANASRVILREAVVGLFNGLVFGVLLGVVALIWFGIGKLGLVIGVAMLINMMAAALSGILIPLVLDRLKFDPAVASAVFVTTITDVVGFFAFLGLATMFLL